MQNGRRSFLKKTAIGAGLLALGAGLGYGGGLAQATGLSGNSRTVITDTEIAARVIAGVRIATEFIPDPVPAGTDADPFPGSAIQAALDDGVAVYIPSGTWRLTSTIMRASDSVTIIGAGRSTKLLLNGAAPVISAGTHTGWLIANLATDAGGVDVSAGTQCRITEIWENGVLTDNRPVGGPPPGTGGYYGVRAEDYITSGAGTPASPWNASAIQSAINALPSRGGIVFIKAGVWQGSTRITVNANGTEKLKHVIFQGEGTWWRQQYGKDANEYMLVGTHVIAGFDIYTPCDFYDMTISPYGLAKGGDGIHITIDPTKMTTNYDWLAGMAIKRVRFWKCDTGLKGSGVNMGGSQEPFQIWGLVVEQCGFEVCNRGIRFDRTDFDAYPTANGNFHMSFNHIECRACTGGEGFRFDIGTSRLEMRDFLVESCGASGSGYAIYVNTYCDGGCDIYSIEDGDGSNSPNFAYMLINRGAYVRALTYGGASAGSQGVTIGGRGYFKIGRSVGTGVVNIVTANEITVERESGQTLSLGSIASPQNVRIIYGPSSIQGYIGTTTPGGSPYTYQNLDSTDENVYLVGGSISDVSRGGQSIGPKVEHFLAPGDSIIITYSSAPSIKRFGVS